MARVTYIHWDHPRSGELIRALERDGHEVRTDNRRPDHIWQPLRDDPGEAIVISLLEKPRWGEQVADATKTSRMKGIPLVFVTEAPLPERLGREHPEAVVAAPDDLALMVQRALGAAPAG